MLCRGERIELEDVLVARPGSAPKARTLDAIVDEAIERALRDALARTGGHRRRAAELLGVERTTLYRHLKRLGLEDL